MNYPEQIPATYSSDSTLERAYRMGWNHGHGIACHEVPEIGDTISPCFDWIGLGKTVTAGNVAEYHELLCFAAEFVSRKFSPFEFITYEFNNPESATDLDSEAILEAFESGVSDSIREDLKSYSYVEADENAPVESVPHYINQLTEMGVTRPLSRSIRVF
jgi:hypothetical protein